MTNPTQQIADIIRRHHYLPSYECACQGDDEFSSTIGPIEHSVHVADEIARVMASWDFLMTLLDAHYPESVFPTVDDRPDRALGPRIVSLMRVIDDLRSQRDEARHSTDDRCGHCSGRVSAETGLCVHGCEGTL